MDQRHLENRDYLSPFCSNGNFDQPVQQNELEPILWMRQPRLWKPWFLGDHLGSTSLVTSASGLVVSQTQRTQGHDRYLIVVIRGLKEGETKGFWCPACADPEYSSRASGSTPARTRRPLLKRPNAGCKIYKLFLFPARLGNLFH